MGSNKTAQALEQITVEQAQNTSAQRAFRGHYTKRVESRCDAVV
jgi:hypothetical protein